MFRGALTKALMTVFSGTYLSVAPLPTLTFTFPESTSFAGTNIRRVNMRNALGGGSMSRAAAGFTQGGTFYAVDFSHEGSGANCVTWNTSFAGATRGQAALSTGTQTAATVAAAWVTAMGLLGATGISRVDNVVTVVNATAKVVGASMPADHESLRGMWGAQRHDFGGAPSAATGQATMGPVVSVHSTGPAAAGRIIGVYALTSGGAADIRMGIADGPAYSTTPAAFSNGVEGVTEENNGIRLFMLPEPMARTAAADKWISFRASDSGNPTIGFRQHSDSPTGQGDLTTSEQVLSNDDGVNDPATAIYSSGAYTHANEIGPFSVYSMVGYLYETPVGGEYPADGGFEARYGYHGAYDNGSPSTVGPSTLDALTETFRMVIPWDCNVVSCYEALADNAADEDSGLAFYDFDLVTLADVPFTESAPLLYDHGPMGASSGGGYKSATLATPLAITAGQVLGVAINHGNDDGVTPADTITTNWDPPGTAGAYLSGWGSQSEGLQGREWSDMADSEDVTPSLAQYLTLTAGEMPVADPDAVWPDPFEPDPDPGSTDLLPNNQFRMGLRLSRTGIT